MLKSVSELEYFRSGLLPFLCLSFLSLALSLHKYLVLSPFISFVLTLLCNSLTNL